MAKKISSFFYIALGLSIIIFVSLFMSYFKIIEGDQNSNKDDFVAFLKINLGTSRGKVVPFPLGSYTLTTTSGKHSNTVDFSMNRVVSVNTNYDVDSGQNIMNRKIIIKPKDTGGSNNINIGDVIPKKFELDISFNQMTYSLTSMAELKGKDMPYENLNYIDGDQNLNITAIGSIYDNNKNIIGNVSMDSKDMDNQKSFIINIQNPQLVDFKLKSIVVTFIIPLPMGAQLGIPVPPPIDSRVMSKIPKLDPDAEYSSYAG